MLSKLAGVVVVGVIVSSGLARGQGADAANLAGVTRLHVAIEEVGEDAERAGLTKARLQTDVEQWLRQKGISVEAGAPAQLYVDIDTESASSGSYAYGIDIGLREPATLQRTGKPVMAEIWSDGSVGTGSSAKLASVIRDKLRELLDGFATDFVAANPKR